MNWMISLDPGPAALERAMALRYRVFVEEQSVPVELEQDGLDDAAHHVVVDVGPDCIATGRLMMKHLKGEASSNAVIAKAQRIAVSPDWRGKGAGKAVMRALEARAKALGASEVLLASQITAVGFYERLGYTAFGEMFMDAGIEHYWMRLVL